MNSETLFFEYFQECFFHTFCIYDNLRYRFNALWCWIFVTVKIILKSGDKIRIDFMSFIVQISPFVHLFTLKIVFCWGGKPLPPGPAGGFKRPPDPSPQVVPTFHFIPSYAPGCCISYLSHNLYSVIELNDGDSKGLVLSFRNIRTKRGY